jgi:hypothetical protein
MASVQPEVNAFVRRHSSAGTLQRERAGQRRDEPVRQGRPARHPIRRRQGICPGAARVLHRMLIR